MFGAASPSDDDAVADFSRQGHEACQQAGSIDLNRSKHDDDERHQPSGPELERAGRVVSPPGRDG